MLSLTPSLRQYQHELPQIKKRINRLDQLGEVYAVYANIMTECWAQNNSFQSHLAVSLFSLQTEIEVKFSAALKSAKKERAQFGVYDNFIEKSIELTLARKEGALYAHRKVSVGPPSLSPFICLHIASFLDENEAYPFFLVTVTRPPRPAEENYHFLSECLSHYRNAEINYKFILFKNLLEISPLAHTDPHSLTYGCTLQQEVFIHFQIATTDKLRFYFEKLEATPQLHEEVLLSNGIRANFRLLMAHNVLKLLKKTAFEYRKI